MSYTLYATFKSPEAAERAAGALLDHGARAEDLSVVKSPSEGYTAATEPTTRATNVLAPLSDGSVAPEETVSSGSAESTAVKGGMIGAGLGAVAAIAALIIPGVGFVIGAGALASAIAGVVATAGAGAAAGAIVGYLKDMGVDEEAASEYGETIQSGGAVLALNVPSGEVDEERANAILKEHGARDVNRYAARGYVA